MADGEFAFTWRGFPEDRALCAFGNAGIVLHRGQGQSRLFAAGQTAAGDRVQSFRDYCALIESADGADERQAMIAAMTTNVTRFFREPHHFDHLESAVMPERSLRRGGKRVRIWSAGCSSGEEPYSIA